METEKKIKVYLFVLLIGVGMIIWDEYAVGGFMIGFSLFNLKQIE